jgi:hypothetical protein
LRISTRPTLNLPQLPPRVCMSIHTEGKPCADLDLDRVLVLNDPPAWDACGDGDGDRGWDAADAVVDALHAAHAFEFVDALPEGAATMLGRALQVESRVLCLRVQGLGFCA